MAATGNDTEASTQSFKANFFHTNKFQKVLKLRSKKVELSIRSYWSHLKVKKKLKKLFHS